MKEQNLGIGLKVALFAFIAIIYLFFRRDGNPIVWPPGYTEVFVIILIWIASETVIWVSRYKLSQVTVNGSHGSFLGEPIEITDKSSNVWCIFGLGESLYPFPTKGKIETLVVPKVQLNKAGNNWVGLTFVKKTPLTYLPNEVFSFLMRAEDKYNLNNIFFGFCDVGFVHQNPDSHDLQSENEQLTNQLNTRDAMLEGRNDVYVDQLEFARELAGQDKKPFFGLFQRNKKADEEE